MVSHTVNLIWVVVGDVLLATVGFIIGGALIEQFLPSGAESTMDNWLSNWVFASLVSITAATLSKRGFTLATRSYALVILVVILPLELWALIHLRIVDFFVLVLFGTPILIAIQARLVIHLLRKKLPLKS